MRQREIVLLLQGPLGESWWKLADAHKKPGGKHSAEYSDAYNEWLYRAGALSSLLTGDYPPVLEMLEVMLAETISEVFNLTDAYEALEEVPDGTASNDNAEKKRHEEQTGIARDLLTFYAYMHDIRVAIKRIKDRMRYHRKKAEQSAPPPSGQSG
jgi:hypothetical protein